MSVDVLNVQRRDTRGKRNAKRMRGAGKIPAVLYGHKQETIALALSTEEVETALRHNAHLFELKGGVAESALIKEVQWDAFGSRILHLDLTRVDMTEAVQVTLEVVLRGIAPGTKQGGVVEHQIRRLEIECPANVIPENLVININHLEVDQTITVGQLELPKGAVLRMDAESVVCTCVVPAVEDEDAEAAGEGVTAEPEVIGRKAEDEAGAPKDK
jgi:large subunit ribosomal protein L25